MQTGVAVFLMEFIIKAVSQVQAHEGCSPGESRADGDLDAATIGAVKFTVPDACPFSLMDANEKSNEVFHAALPWV